MAFRSSFLATILPPLLFLVAGCSNSEALAPILDPGLVFDCQPGQDPGRRLRACGHPSGELVRRKRPGPAQGQRDLLLPADGAPFSEIRKMVLLK